MSMENVTVHRGVSVIDTIVGIALLLLVFTGLTGVLQLTVSAVSNNKARIGALSLANERLEYIRSLPYLSVGTTSGIPNGAIPQTENVSLNGVNYTRTTLIRYVDAPEDGLDPNDENDIPADYKEVKVTVAWQLRGNTRSVSLVARVSPPGLETTVPGGTLRVLVTNAVGDPVPQALVSITNASVTPPVDIDVLSNDGGYATFIGAPAGAGYAISVTKSNYSTAQTYGITAQNPNPNPGHSTVAEGMTTAPTFAIDQLGTMSVETYGVITEGEWEDLFASDSKIATSSNVDITSGTVRLTLPNVWGAVQSEYIAPLYLAGWKRFEWGDSTPGLTTIRYHVYYPGYSGVDLVPDTDLPGNSAGFDTSPVDISGLSTTTYPSLRLGAELETTELDTAPAISDWRVLFDQGPTPLSDIEFTLRGTKVIGEDASSQPIYKYSETHSSGSTARVSGLSLEWDTYTLTVDGTSEGYDIAESCEPQPRALTPGATMLTRLYFAPHTLNSLLVDVRGSGGALLSGATVTLSRDTYSETHTTGTCGQVFFSGLSSGTIASDNTYSLQVIAGGYTAFNSNQIEVSGASRYSVALEP